MSKDKTCAGDRNCDTDWTPVLLSFVHHDVTAGAYDHFTGKNSQATTNISGDTGFTGNRTSNYSDAS
jgi:hypothetical protein